MDILGRRIVVAFVKQRHFIFLALIAGAIFSFTHAPTAFAAETGRWIDNKTISYKNQNFVGPDVQSNGKYRYTTTGSTSQSCKAAGSFDTPPSDFIDFDKDPTSTTNPHSPGHLTTYTESADPVTGDIKCDENKNITIDLQNTDRAVLPPEYASCAGKSGDALKSCITQIVAPKCASDTPDPNAAQNQQACIDNAVATLMNSKGIGGSPAPSGDNGNKSTVKCVLNNSLGWIICPISEALGSVTFTIAQVVESLLQTSPLPINAPALGNGDTSKAIYLVWSQVRNLANIALVIAFVFIIYSQATSFGLSNYGIKKMLPKLVVAAILINISYFVCALLIDVFNLLGAGVAGLFTAMNGAIPSLDLSVSWSSILTNTLTGLGLGAAGFAAVAIAGGAVAVISAMWPLALLALLTVTLAILAVLAVLVFRMIAIILLVIVSPLAFAAWLLPNTEDYFKKWLNFFQNLLVMYPMAMAIIYGSILGSNLIQNVVVIQADTGIKEYVAQIFGLLALALPLFSLPFLFKFAGALGSKIGAAVNNPNRGPIDRARKAARERADLITRGAKADRRNKALEKFGDPDAFGAKGRKGTRGLRKGYAYSRLWGATTEDRAEERKHKIEAAGKRRQTMRAEEKALGTDRGAAYRRIIGQDGAAMQEHDDESFALDSRQASANTQAQLERAKRLSANNSALLRSAVTPGVQFDAANGQTVKESAAGRRILASANATLLREQTEVSRQKAEARESVSRMFNGDFDLAEAFINSRGDINHAAAANLTAPQRVQFERMVGQGMHKRAESYEAALRIMAEGGKGDEATISNALQQMNTLGADATDIGGAAEYIRSTYRGKGRGDLVARVAWQPSTPQDVSTMLSGNGFGTNWGEIKADAISRHAVNDPAIRQSLVQYMGNNAEYTRSVVMKLDNLQDERARPGVIQALEEAYVGKARPDGTTYTKGFVAEQMRDDFGLNPGGGRVNPAVRPAAAGGPPQNPGVQAQQQNQPTPPAAQPTINIPHGATGGFTGNVNPAGLWTPNPSPMQTGSPAPAASPQPFTLPQPVATAQPPRPAPAPQQPAPAPQQAPASNGSGPMPINRQEQYTKGYTVGDLQSLPPQHVEMLVNSAGGVNRLTDADLTKIISATGPQHSNPTGARDLNDRAWAESDRRETLRNPGGPQPPSTNGS